MERRLFTPSLPGIEEVPFGFTAIYSGTGDKAGMTVPVGQVPAESKTKDRARFSHGLSFNRANEQALRNVQTLRAPVRGAARRNPPAKARPSARQMGTTVEKTG